MYYFIQKINDIEILVTSTELPKNMEGITLITKEEYLKEAEARAAAIPEEEVEASV